MLTRIRGLLKQIREILNQWWQERTPATKALPKYLWQVYLNYARKGSRQAATLAYYAIFSVFPLTLLIAVGIGNLVGPAVAQEQIINGLNLFLPEATVFDIQSTVQGALGESQSFGLVAIIGLGWAATGLFSNITLALDTIFGIEAIRSFWRQRLLAIIMGLTLLVLVLASFATSGILRLISLFLLDRPNVWVTIGIFFLPLGLDVVIFGLLYRYIPARHVHWDAVWPAALLGALGWELAKRAFEWYLSNLATYSVIYGGIATGIVLLFWAYLIASIFLFSAELCARLNEWIIDQENSQKTNQESWHIERQLNDISYASLTASSPKTFPPPAPTIHSSPALPDDIPS